MSANVRTWRPPDIKGASARPSGRCRRNHMQVHISECEHVGARVVDDFYGKVDFLQGLSGSGARVSSGAVATGYCRCASRSDAIVSTRLSIMSSPLAQSAVRDGYLERTSWLCSTTTRIRRDVQTKNGNHVVSTTHTKHGFLSPVIVIGALSLCLPAVCMGSRQTHRPTAPARRASNPKARRA